MTSEFFSSSYKQYKNDTSAFTTWLGRAAELCGYKQPAKPKKLSESAPKPPPSAPTAPPAPKTASAPAPRLKGKARAAAKKAQAHVEPERTTQSEEHVPTVKEYAVTTQELLEQIETVSKSKSKVSMPSGIKKVLERAIDARRRCSDWYESAKHDAAILDNGGHRHFISLLQDAFTKLSTGPTAEPKRSRQNTLGPTKKGTTGLENRFASLEVEDTDENFELSPTEVALATRTSHKKVDSVDIFALEEERAFDDAFAVFCFFEDLHRAQKSIRQVWKDSVSGRTSLVSATIITQSMVTHMRRAEQELCSQLFPDISPDDSYAALASILVEATIISKGLHPGGGSHVNVTPFDDFIFLPVARTLQKYMNLAALKNKLQWPQSIMPLSIHFSLDSENADTRTAEHKKLMRDDRLLTQLLLDAQLPDQVANGAGKKALNLVPVEEIRPAQEDIFLRTMRPLWFKQELSVTTVVMAQIMLDIHHACGPKVPRFYGQLTHSRKYSSDSFDFQVLADGGIKTGGVNWTHSESGNLSKMHTLLRRIEKPGPSMMKGIMMDVKTTPKIYTWSNTTPEFRKDFREKYGGFDENLRPSSELERQVDEAMNNSEWNFIKPSPDNDFLMTHNPLYSGSAMLKLLLDYHHLGLALANHHMSIFLAAHLYNALRQLKMLKTSWPVMDRIIELHKKAIFANDIPTKTFDMADRLSYRIDAENKRQKRHHLDAKYEFKAPTSIEPLRMILEADVSTQARALFKIEQNLEHQEKTSNEIASISRNLQHGKPQTTPERYVKSLEKVLSPVLDDLSIDYVRLTKKCIALLDRFRTMWNIEIENEQMGIPLFVSDKVGQNTNDLGHLYMCHQAFEEAKAIRENGIYSYRAGDGGDRAVTGMEPDVDCETRHGMGLLTAMKVFKHFLAKEDTDFRFPFKISDVALLEAEAKAAAKSTEGFSAGIREISTGTELLETFAGSTYTVVNFYTDYSRTPVPEAHDFAKLSRKHTVPSLLAFVKANTDDMHDVANRFDLGGVKQGFVCFKEGKQVAVNGKKVTHGRKPLENAVEKLSALAQKRLAEQGKLEG